MSIESTIGSIISNKVTDNNSSENLNCNIIASNQRGMHTLQQIGNMLNITRMRVCQIEKSVYNKILKKFSAF